MARRRGPKRRLTPLKTGAAYRSLWRIVDGAVSSAFHAHPEYLTPEGKRAARGSINKRVVASVLSFAAQVAKGRSENNLGGQNRDGIARVHPEDGAS